MTASNKKYLSDISTAIDLIEDFTSHIVSYEQYLSDRKTQSAVERQLGIIGEAVNRYQQANPQASLSNSKKIISFRNRIIHAYDSIDNTIVWVILQKYMQPLKKEVLQKLEE
jgi:uncharacterized protein with HEPN domain